MSLLSNGITSFISLMIGSDLAYLFIHTQENQFCIYENKKSAANFPFAALR